MIIPSCLPQFRILLLTFFLVPVYGSDCRAEDQQERLVLKAHSKMVKSLAFSPDGKILASASLDGTAKLWDAATGKLIRTFRSDRDPIFDRLSEIRNVAFGPKGKRLVGMSTDGKMKVWDVDSGKQLLAIKHSIATYGFAFSPDGKHLASANLIDFKVWDAATGKELRTMKGRTGLVYCLAFSPDGKRLASGGERASVQLWHTATGKALRSLKKHRGPVYSVAFSPDGTQLASAGLDETIRVSSANTGKELLALTGNAGPVKGYDCVAFSPDGKQLASAGSAIIPDDKNKVNGIVTLWDLVSGKPTLTLKAGQSGTFSVAFSPDGKQLASGNENGTIAFWDVSGQTNETP